MNIGASMVTMVLVGGTAIDMSVRVDRRKMCVESRIGFPAAGIESNASSSSSGAERYDKLVRLYLNRAFIGQG